MVLPEPHSLLLLLEFWGGSWDKVTVKRGSLSRSPTQGSVHERQKHQGGQSYGSQLHWFCFQLKYLIFLKQSLNGQFGQSCSLF